jgi:serine/threonine protein kinase
VSEDFPVLAGLRAGSLVAGYRLETQVGAGGMAVVFRARDERLGRLVALKILSPALAADEEFRRRFIAESRAAAVVDDPHIIPVFEAGEADGVLFIAMRFVVGGDLRRVLVREGLLPPGRAAGFISPVASALDAAHGTGLVHRDVKPANILVDARSDRPDHVYLSDFGVSKGAVTSVSLPGTGHFLGTPDYSAPEQIQGYESCRDFADALRTPPRCSPSGARNAAGGWPSRTWSSGPSAPARDCPPYQPCNWSVPGTPGRPSGTGAARPASGRATRQPVPATLTTRPHARVQETGRRSSAHGSIVTYTP